MRIGVTTRICVSQAHEIMETLISTGDHNVHEQKIRRKFQIQKDIPGLKSFRAKNVLKSNQIVDLGGCQMSLDLTQFRDQKMGTLKG